nr:fructosamine kinase family protein [Mucilaginibacter pedocola]
MIDKAVTAAVEDILFEKIIKAQSVSGGDINEAYCLQTSDNKYFIKVNSAKRFPNMFEREAEGLKRIAQTAAINVPLGIACGEADGYSYFLMEWVNAARPDDKSFASLGEGLASLHRATSELFGFDTDNYRLPASKQ